MIQIYPQIQFLILQHHLKDKIQYEEKSDISKYTGEMISQGKIVLWFQGCMEFGPRALGNRSILASAEDIECKNKLNLIIKKRPYFQPFCPTIIEEDASKILEFYDKANRFMTVGYLTKQNVRNKKIWERLSFPTLEKCRLE